VFLIVRLGLPNSRTVEFDPLAFCLFCSRRMALVIATALNWLVFKTAAQCFEIAAPSLATQANEVPFAITGIRVRV